MSNENDPTRPTDPVDDLMQRLTAADPVDHGTIPAAEDPVARQLMENIISGNRVAAEINQNQHLNEINEENDMNSNRSRRHLPPSAEVDGQAVLGLENDGVRPLSTARRTQLRGRGMLIGAAAAVLLLVGGLLVFSPDNTPSAVAAVQSAAAAASDADTGRISTTFALTAEGGDTPIESIEGRFDASYSGSDVAASLQVDEQSGQFDAGDLPVNDVRLVDDVLYVDNDGQWLAIDTDGMLGGLVADFIDPRVVLDTVQGLTEASEVGPVTIDGVETTHYQSIVDLGDESLSQSGWLGFEGVPIEADGEVTVDLYVDGNGLLNQLDLSGDVEDPAESGESGTFDVSMRFFDVGSDITIEAPSDAEVFDPAQGLFEED